MIVIDSSVVISTIRQEPENEDYLVAMRAADERVMSAANYLECAMVLMRLTASRAPLDEWIAHFTVSVEPVDLSQAKLAADAFARFGRGRHPARLNYGDCFAYALAASRNAPLLYRGSDFAKTDIRSALESHA